MAGEEGCAESWGLAGEGAHEDCHAGGCVAVCRCELLVSYRGAVVGSDKLSQIQKDGSGQWRC